MPNDVIIERVYCMGSYGLVGTLHGMVYRYGIIWHGIGMYGMYSMVYMVWYTSSSLTHQCAFVSSKSFVVEI